MAGHLRGIIGTLTLEELYRELDDLVQLVSTLARPMDRRFCVRGLLRSGAFGPGESAALRASSDGPSRHEAGG